MATPSADAAMSPETVQAAANADPCHDHSKNFADCLNSHEIRLGKCRDHLHLLFQCRQKAVAAMRPFDDVEEVAAEVAVPAASIGNPDSCHIPYQKLKDCLNNDDEVRVGKCELHLHVLFACHMRARELWN